MVCLSSLLACRLSTIAVRHCSKSPQNLSCPAQGWCLPWLLTCRQGFLLQSHLQLQIRTCSFCTFPHHRSKTEELEQLDHILQEELQSCLRKHILLNEGLQHFCSLLRIDLHKLLRQSRKRENTVQGMNNLRTPLRRHRSFHLYHYCRFPQQKDLP